MYVCVYICMYVYINYSSHETYNVLYVIVVKFNNH